MNTLDYEQQTILSICIPTYNRDAWLDTSLQIICEEISSIRSGIEIIISNNASTDHTDFIVEKYKKLLPIKYNKNTENIGAVKNISKCISFASGKYIWILGDDDFLIAGFLPKFLKIIKENADVSLFFVDMVIWHPEVAYVLGDRINYESHVDADVFNIKDIQFERFDSIKDIATFDKGYFNAISNIILPKSDYATAMRIGADSGSEFTSVESTFPHSCFIAKHLLHKPCIAITTTGLICSAGISWGRYFDITYLKWYPELIMLMESNGTDGNEASRARRKIIEAYYVSILPRAFRGTINNYHVFSWRRFFADNYRFKELWIVFLRMTKKGLAGILK